MRSGLPLPFVDSLRSDRRREFYEQHRYVAVTMILIVLLLPFAGLFVSGLFGAFLGALLSFVAYFLTPYLLLKLGR